MADEKKKTGGAVVTKCDCESSFQDQQYGKGNRVMSYCKEGRYGRCTVCDKEKAV